MNRRAGRRRVHLLAVSIIVSLIAIIAAQAVVAAAAEEAARTRGRAAVATGPRTWLVRPDGSGDAPTIQAAVDSASSGDTVFLGIGTFLGEGNRGVVIPPDMAINFYGHSDFDDTDANVIDCEHEDGAFILSAPARALPVTSTFRGITIRNGGVGQKPAIRIMGRVAVVLERCFVERSAGDAIAGVPGAHVYVRYSAIRDNAGRPYAGSGELTLTSCFVERNGKPLGGAQDLSLVVKHSVLAHNAGHAIYTWASHINIEESLIADNGGFSVVADGTLRIVRTEILRNRGPIYIERESVWLEDNVIAGNRGGLRLDLAGGTVKGNTIVGNGVSDGVVIETTHGGQQLTHNIIAFNRGARLFNTRENNMVVTGCDIVDNAVGAMGPYDDGGGNFSADPWFCDRDADNYYLATDSPCLPQNNPPLPLVGARDAGCDVVRPDMRVTPGIVAMRSRGVVSVTLGDGGNLDISTVRLDGVAPLRAVGEGHGGGAGADRVTDVTAGHGAGAGERGNPRGSVLLKFAAQDILAALAPVTPGTSHTLTLSARLTSGEHVRARADIVIVPAGAGVSGDGDGAGDGDKTGDEAGADKGTAASVTQSGDAAAGDGTASQRYAAPPARPGLIAVTPNPFNPVTRIRFGVVRAGVVDLTVYDIAGRVVERVTHERMGAGEHEVTWEANGVASGVYFARLTTPDGAWTRKLVVTK